MDQEIKPYYEKRPWGEFITFAKNEMVTVKILTIKSGQSFSLQYHNNRSEEWHVISGEGTILIGENTHQVVIGQTHIIPPKTNHRITSTGKDVVILEVARGVFDEKDIIRIEDQYGRVN